MIFQMSLLFRGALTASSHMVLQPALSQVLEKNISLSVAVAGGAFPTTTPDSIDVFGRVYDTGGIIVQNNTLLDDLACCMTKYFLFYLKLVLLLKLLVK